MSADQDATCGVAVLCLSLKRSVVRELRACMHMCRRQMANLQAQQGTPPAHCRQRLLHLLPWLRLCWTLNFEAASPPPLPPSAAPAAVARSAVPCTARPPCHCVTGRLATGAGEARAGVPQHEQTARSSMPFPHVVGLQSKASTQMGGTATLQIHVLHHPSPEPSTLVTGLQQAPSEKSPHLRKAGWGAILNTNSATSTTFATRLSASPRRLLTMARNTLSCSERQ